MALFGKKNQTEQVSLPENLPQHIAFIMDGNGRWAKKRSLPRKFGHREGAKTFKKIARYCKAVSYTHLDVYKRQLHNNTGFFIE